jgi:hypothetical protein
MQKFFGLFACTLHQWFGDDKEPAPFFVRAALDAGLQHQMMAAGVDLPENIVRAAARTAFQVNEIAVRAAWVERPKMQDAGNPLSLAALIPVHGKHPVADLEFAEIPASQVIVRD